MTKTTLHSSLIGYLAALLSGVCFGSAPIFIKFAFRFDLYPEQVLILQYLFVTLLMFIPGIFLSKKMFLVNKKDIVPLILTGLFYYGTWYCYTQALVYITASQCAILLYTYPVWVTIGARIFFREKMQTNRYWALLLAVVGTFFASGIDLNNMGSFSPVGISLALTAAISCSFFFLISQYILKDTNPWTVTFYVHLLSLALICVLRFQDLVLIPGVQLEGAVIVLGMSIISTVTPFFLMMVGIQLIGASKTSICAMVEMPSTILLAFLFLVEVLLPLQFVGGGLILLGVLLLYWERDKNFS